MQMPDESRRHGGSGPEVTGQSPTAAFYEWLWYSPLFEARESPQEYPQERAVAVWEVILVGSATDSRTPVL